MVPTKRGLYRLLSTALIEIREKGYASNDKVVFSLADLFHNIPANLYRLERDEITVQDIMRELEEHARRRGIEGWLDLRLRELAKNHPECVSDEDTSE